MNGIEEWFEKLPLDKHMFIAQHVKKKIDKIQKDTESILDSCYIAAMIELFDMNLDDCIKIAEKANENMDITLKVLNKEGEKYYMKVNNEELRSEIKVEIKTLIKENRKINNLEIIRVLKESYDLPNKDFQILIKESREELGKEALQEIEKDIQNDEMNSELSDREKEIELSKLPKYATGEIKANLLHEADHGFECPKGAKEKQLSDKLLEAIKPALHKGMKIKSMEVEGADGRIYLKSSEGVKLGDKVYKDISDVKHDVEVLESNTSAREDEINKKIEELKKQLQIEKEYKKTELEKYAEIEMVFQM